MGPSRCARHACCSVARRVSAFPSSRSLGVTAVASRLGRSRPQVTSNRAFSGLSCLGVLVCSSALRRRWRGLRRKRTAGASSSTDRKDGDATAIASSHHAWLRNWGRRLWPSNRSRRRYKHRKAVGDSMTLSGPCWSSGEVCSAWLQPGCWPDWPLCFPPVLPIWLPYLAPDRAGGGTSVAQPAHPTVCSTVRRV